MWLTVVARYDRGNSGHKGIQLGDVRGKRAKCTRGRRSAPPGTKPELPSTCTISSAGKYMPALIPLLVDLMLLMETNMTHTNAIMQLEQCFDPFPALNVVFRLLANASTNKIVGPVDRASVDKIMGFLAKWLAAMQSLPLEEENQVVSMLADATQYSLQV